MSNVTIENCKHALADIVAQAMCIGCGFCEGIAGRDAIRMIPAQTGYLHPELVGSPSLDDFETILSCCPSRHLQTLPAAEQSVETKHDKIWGPYRRLVHGWASDPEERFEGSTGGVLTALAAFLVNSGTVDFVLHAKASETDPPHGEHHLSFSRADVLAGAGSRYGPTAVLSDIGAILDRGQPFAFIGKPCDVSALRNYAMIDPRVDALVKYRMTLVCGGFMPPEGTEAFLDQYGVTPQQVVHFRYRGRGFPGPTRFETKDGDVFEKTYYDFWGENYDRWTLPHRCKICPDSIGEGTDIVAADPWPGGGPDLSDDSDPGTNVIIARTEAGVLLLHAAESAGALTLGSEATLEQMNNYQPHQVARKYTSWARLEGLKAENRMVPETSGLRIAELAQEMTQEFLADQTQGTRLRVQEGTASEKRPDWDTAPALGLILKP